MSSIDNFELDENVKLEVRPRESETIALQIPKDAIESLKKIAAQRKMSPEALLRFYVGKCLRQDLSQQFASQHQDATLPKFDLGQ